LGAGLPAAPRGEDAPALWTGAPEQAATTPHVTMSDAMVEKVRIRPVS
jgi:hypothetical protein